MTFYHVFLTIESKGDRFESRLDLAREQLEERFLIPYKTGKSITTGGRNISIDNIDRMKIFKTDKSSVCMKTIAEQHAIRVGALTTKPLVAWYIEDEYGIDVTDQFITGPPGYKSDHINIKQPSKDSKKIFVVHGRNDNANEAMFSFLRSIGLMPLEWSKLITDTGRTMPHITEILESAFSQAHAVIVLITPDEKVRLRKPFHKKDDLPHDLNFSEQARPNVLFEAGMAMGNNPDRTIIVEIGRTRPFSDISGLHIVRLDNSSQRRQELAKRLESIGCPVDLTGTDWHSCGDFEVAVAEEKKSDSKRIRYYRI